MFFLPALYHSAMARYQCSLFIFRRDLRLEDNTALIRALGASVEVIPAFILDPRQINDNAYKSANAIQFMRESLQELFEAISRRKGRLFIFEGKAEEVVAELLGRSAIEAVFLNTDYTPFSRRRDLAIKKLCAQRGVAFEESDDALLFPPGAVMKKDGGPYTVFTPFMKTAMKMAVPVPQPVRRSNFFQGELRSARMAPDFARLEVYTNPEAAVRGGSSRAASILKDLARFKDYDRERDIPSVDGTTHLSAHLKFGTVSARAAYHAIRQKLGAGHTLIRELLWRDFFSHVAYHFPHVFGNAFYDEYDTVPWQNDKHLFEAWCEGRTGFPIVDAGMRELNTTGFMHNRVRMITASFLVKDLHIDWRWGEKYFARKLIDYDPAVNNGNWQWAASTGCDHQPYFRIFNPWLQQKRYDPDCIYIHKWIPELRPYPAGVIHSLGEGKVKLKRYHAPIIIHSDAAAWAKAAFKDASRRGKNY